MKCSLFSSTSAKHLLSIYLDSQLSQNRITSDVTQGSVLGPLLNFLIYINDSVRKKFNTGGSVTMYADDLLLYKVINSPDDYKLIATE